MGGIIIKIARLAKLFIYAFILSLILGCSSVNTENDSELASFSQLTVISDSDVEAIYEKAWEAFSWFTLTTIPYLETEEVTDFGITFERPVWTEVRENWSGTRVVHETINTMEALRAYLDTFFTNNVTEYLLSFERFIEHDGNLYTIVADRGTNMFAGDELHEIIRVSANEIVYRVSVDMYDSFPDEPESKIVDVEVSDFHLVYENESWRFSNFHLVR